MAKFDWNEIIVTNEAGIVNEQVKDRMILVTGEKGDKGDPGRGIVSIKKSSTTPVYDNYIITYTDGTKSTFSINRIDGGGGGIIYFEFYVDAVNGNDDNTGDQESPFRTIKKALETATLGSYVKIVVLSESTYSGTLTIDSINVDFYLENNINIVVSGGLLITNSRVRFYRGSVETTGNVSISESDVYFKSCQLKITGTHTNSLHLVGSRLYVSHPIMIIGNTSTTTAVLAEGASHADLYEMILQCYIGIDAREGSIISYKEMTGTVTVEEHTETGGRILRGEQKSNVNTYSEYWVDKTEGSDTWEGTQEQPFQTINKALQSIPKGSTATVNFVREGLFAESIVIDEQNIEFRIPQGKVVTINGSVDINNSRVRFFGGFLGILNELTISNSFAVFQSTLSTSIASGNTVAIHLVGSKVYTYGQTSITCDDPDATAIRAEGASHADFGNLALQCDTGISAREGSIISYREMSGTVTTAEHTESGGRILKGEQLQTPPSDRKFYGMRNGDWTEMAWGYISGNITAQNDLVTYITQKIDQMRYSSVFYIDPVNGDDTNDGDSTHPLATIAKALEKGTGSVILHLVSDTYNESPDFVGNVTLDLAGNTTITGVVNIEKANMKIESSNATLTFTSAGGVTIINSDVVIEDTDIVGTSVVIKNNSHVMCNSDLVLSETRGETLQISDNSFAYFESLDLTALTGIVAETGSVLSCNTLIEDTTMADRIESGARFYEGSVDVPSDNKTYGRMNKAWSEIYSKTNVDNLLNGKQDKLTFDTTPTAGSTKPVTSDGIKTALDGKQDTLTFDTTPTYHSTNPVTSGGVEAEITRIDNALSGKQPTLTFDTTPTANSTNPVTSGGIKTALNAKADSSNVYSKTQTNSAISTAVAGKANASDVYSKSEIDAALDDIDSALDDKADANDVYTKTETDTVLANKADANDVYTKTEADEKLDKKADAIVETITYYLDELAQLKSLKDEAVITADPYQRTFDGDPSATNICPFFAIRSGTCVIGAIDISSTTGDYVVRYTIPSDIYGCEIDPVTGKVYKTWERIASYAGEILPGEWKSDRDVYSAAGVPTIGAEVVYKLTNRVEITPTILDTIPDKDDMVGLNLLFRAMYVLGTNDSISERIVPISISAVVDTKTYIDNTINYGYCETAEAIAAKTVDIPNFELKVGSLVVVKFQHANTADNPTLNVSGTGAKPMYQYGTTAIADSNTSTGWASGSVMLFVYDGTGWIRNYFYNTTYTVAAASCGTSAGTAAKTASCSYYYADKPQYFQLIVRYNNTYAGAITLNVNSSGAKPVYIDGQPSSAENYTLPRGPYIVYYDGENYYFDTTGKIPDVPKVYVSYANETLWICHNKVKTINIYNQNMSNVVGRSVSWSKDMDYQFILEVLPNDANPNVVWSSSDESAITIDQDGHCWGLTKNVPSVITATAMDGSGVKASFTMTFK